MVEELQGGVVPRKRDAVRGSHRSPFRSLPLCAKLGLTAVMLAGCNLSSGAGQSPTFTPTVYNGPVGSFRAQMDSAGNDYAGAVSYGDTAHIDNLVGGCYSIYDQESAVANLGSSGQFEVRRCLEIDYLAYKDNQALTNRGLPGNPYFTMDAFEQRMSRHAFKAGFTNPYDVFQWDRDGYMIAKPTEMDALHNRGGGFQLQAPHNASGAFGG